MKSFKIELDPNNRQRTAMLRHVGAARWAYNWGLQKIKDAADAGEKWPSAIDLHKQLNAIKGTEELPWGYDVSKCAFQGALRNLDTAVKRWRTDRKKSGGRKSGFPKFKSRKNGVGTCRFDGTIKVFDGSIQLPRIGLIRLKEHGYFPEGAKVSSATISERAGRWFVSVQTDLDRARHMEKTGETIGVDVGIKVLAYCSDGESFDNPKALSAKTKQMARWQRRLSRRVKGSKNREKAKAKVAKLHMQVANIRHDARNKAARAIVDKAPSKIVIEDLNVSGMVKNHKLAKALSDASLGNFHRVLSYMAEDAGIEVVKANRFFASSKICSCCGWKDTEQTLSDRTFKCQSCGFVEDRDRNAAINLKNYTASSAEIHACGDRVSPRLASAVVIEAGTKQQISTVGIFV